jgi:Cu(I)/Ag(I) efflux system membrane fusion protein
MNRQLLISSFISLAIGISLGLMMQDDVTEVTGQTSGASPSGKSVSDKKDPLFYRNPMDPNITSPVPAKDHMGMDYIPVFAEEDASGPAGTVRVDPVTIQSMGVRTFTATHADISRQIKTAGRIGYDETTIYRLHPKTEGWIEELRVQTTGEKIEYDDILLSLYSPQLVATEQEYLLALENLEQLAPTAGKESRRSARRLVETARQRLDLLDVPAHQVEEIEKSREAIKELHIHAPGPGTVIKVGARRGQYVTPMTELYFIADLSRVWVYVDIFEDELPWVRVGDRSEMTLNGLPGRVFEGNLTYIYPYAERSTRTIKARLEFDNSEGLLKPDMLADILISTRAARHVLVVPSEAIIRSGLREVVFVQTAPGRFEPREVGSQFLIDSESKLREAAAKMVSRQQNPMKTDMDMEPGHQPGMEEHQHD